jgi:hypothetical protein
MTNPVIDADTLLAVDIGSITTRALFFDVVEGRYRFLAAGTSPTTANAPHYDLGEGVRRAIDQLQLITGRTFLGQNDRLIMPASDGMEGVDTFAATMSAGQPLKAVIAGLLDDVSLDSVRRLAESTYSGVVDALSLTDRRRFETRVDTILRLRPDIILVAGGTENGASQSLMKLVDSISLACRLLPETQRPEVLFAGNSALQDEVVAALRDTTRIHTAPNVRPNLENEQLDPAQVLLSEVYTRTRAKQMPGVRELDEWANGGLMPTASAFGRMIRFLSRAYASKKGVLGVDVGASATSLAAAFQGELITGVYPQYGLGNGQGNFLENIAVSEISRWIPLQISEGDIRDYVSNKALYPASIPTTPDELTFEAAMAKAAMQAAIRKLYAGFPTRSAGLGSGLLPYFEPLLVTGSVITNAPSLAHSLMMILDGIQPTGITTIVLDQNHLAAPLGAAAAVNPTLAVQVLDSNTFLYLGTVIVPVGNVRPGTPVLRLKIAFQDGHEVSLDVKQGTLEMVPLPLGQTARMQLQPLHRCDVGMGGPGRGGKLKVHGGALGIVIDARGRPLRLPADIARRQELMKKWLWTLGE